MGPPTHEQEKCRGAIHIHVEKSFHCGTLWCLKHITNAPMVQPLQKSQMKLKVFRPEISNPKLSAQMTLEGNFDFNKDTPRTPQ